MATSTINGDLYVAGSFNARSVTLPSGAVDDNAVKGAAGIQATKLQHQYQPVYSQVSTANAAVDRKVVYVVQGTTATIVSFQVGAVTAAGAASTATFDLLKNGTTILSGTISLDNTTASFALKSPAGFTSTSLVVGDVLEVSVTAVSGASLAKGLFARLTLREDAQ